MQDQVEALLEKYSNFRITVADFAGITADAPYACRRAAADELKRAVSRRENAECIMRDTVTLAAEGYVPTTSDQPEQFSRVLHSAIDTWLAASEPAARDAMSRIIQLIASKA